MWNTICKIYDSRSILARTYIYIVNFIGCFYVYAIFLSLYISKLKLISMNSYFRIRVMNICPTLIYVRYSPCFDVLLAPYVTLYRYPFEIARLLRFSGFFSDFSGTFMCNRDGKASGRRCEMFCTQLRIIGNCKAVLG